MFGGERFIYFVSGNDEIVQFSDSPTGGLERTEDIQLELSELTHTNGLIYRNALTLTARFYKFAKGNINFVPSEYYRNSTSIYILDVDRIRLLRIDGTGSFMHEFKRKIKKVITGPLSAQFLVLDEANELWSACKNETAVKIELPKGLIVRCGGAFSGGFIIVDQDNNMYVKEKGDHIKFGLGITGNIESLTHVHTFLQDNYTIDQIEGGYYHAIFRSRDGEVFATGYDNMNQASFEVNGNHSGNNNLTKCPFEYGECVKIGGFSRGEYLMNTKDEVYFVSEMFEGFSHKQFDEYPFVQRFDLNELSQIAQVEHLKYNDIVNSGWQCCIFHNPKKTLKGNTRIREKLFEIANNLKLVDVSIQFSIE